MINPIINASIYKSSNEVIFSKINENNIIIDNEIAIIDTMTIILLMDNPVLLNNQAINEVSITINVINNAFNNPINSFTLSILAIK